MKKNLRITVGEKSYAVQVEVVDDPSNRPLSQAITPAAASTTPVSAPTPSGPPKIHAPGEIASPLAGVILKINVKEGDSIQSGQPLIVLEAMKMENIIHSSAAGTVKSVAVSIGQNVEEGQVLLTLS